MPITRRALLIGVAATISPLGVRAAPAAMVVNKDPNCGCCSGWVDHVKAAGFEVRVVETRICALEITVGRPPCFHPAHCDRWLCHRRTRAGASSSGCSPSAPRLSAWLYRDAGWIPGMEVPGAPDDTYNVVLFGLPANGSMRGTKVHRS